MNCIFQVQALVTASGFEVIKGGCGKKEQICVESLVT